MSLGYGTDYEAYLLKKIAQKICQKYRIKSVLEFPKTNLLGEGAIFPKTKESSPDLVWNFCEFEQTIDSHGFAKKIADLADKYALVITQNYFNPGVLIHWMFHCLSGKKWDHGQLRKMSGLAIRQAFLKAKIWKIKEFSAFDIPWFILDVYETGKYFRHLPFLKHKIKTIKESRFESWPLIFRLWLGHHHYLLFKKQIP